LPVFGALESPPAMAGTLLALLGMGVGLRRLVFGLPMRPWA
jgi:hypothetical protein